MARASKKLLIFLDNSGYEVSLGRRKIYVSVPDARAERLGQIRIRSNNPTTLASCADVQADTKTRCNYSELCASGGYLAGAPSQE
jgi:hypothetical protein